MSGIAERLAQVLAEHHYRDVLGDYEWPPFYKHFGCSCGWEQNIAGMNGWRSWVAAHEAHLAEIQAELVEREIAAARGEALREAADAWTQGGWADAMLPKPTHTAAPVIAYSNRMGDWLRNRAALSSDPDRGEGEA